MDLVSLAGKLGQLLLAEKKFLVTAESCTGGGIAKAVTEVAGSSGWFERSVVTYSNQAKTRYLGVDSQLIETHGVVSQQVVEAMAAGAAERSDEVSISVSGIAGPDGGTEKKPVGTVWFGFSVDGEIESCCQIFSGDRSAVRDQATRFALETLAKRIANRAKN